MFNEKIYIYGIHTCLSQIKNNPENINKIYIKKSSLNKNLQNISDIAKEKDIIEFKNIEPSHNKAVLILSTPNSYHKGKCSDGLRRFLYWGYSLNKNCWINSKSY